MTKLRTGFRKAASVFMSALLTMSVFSVGTTLSTLDASAASYSELSALDSQAYSGNDLGATYSKTSTTFKVWAPTASDVKIKRYTTGSDSEAGASVIETKEMTKGSQGVWSVTISGDLNGTYYTYLVTANGSTKETVDIYARSTGVNGKRGMVLDLDSTDPAGWASDKRVECENQTDSVIWEVHVKDFSSSSDSGMTNKGKFLAFTETGTTVNNDGKNPTGIDYLEDLGVTHVHLLPVYDYASIDETSNNADLFNWGYDPMNYNTPEGSYSTNPYDGSVRVNEFKQMVKSLHDKGIGVVMDVVYNHTYSGGSGINDWFDYTVPGYYYRQTSTGAYSDASGCGNETASDRAMCRKFIVDSVVYWATEYHLDGFRFDLMGVHDVDTMNAVRAALDEIDPEIIVYGEPWTAAATPCPKPTAVQGNMSLVSEEVAAFNDKVRDAIKGSCFNAYEKGFIQGGTGFETALKGGIQANSTTMGNAKWSKQPSQTVTYTSAHDNYTLYDKLTLSVKGGSGYGNRYDDLVAMNKMAGGIILTSQGMSFFQAGEEFSRSKYGDENSYKSSASINQLKWTNTITYQDVVSYYKGLIEIRKAYSPFRDPTNASNDTIYFSWGTNCPTNVVAFTMYNTIHPDTEWNYVAVIHNSNDYQQTVTLQTYDTQTLPSTWVIVADGSNAGTTSLGTTGSTLTVPGRSTVVLVDKTSFDRTDISSKCSVTVNHIISSSGTTYKTETLKGKEGASYTTSPLSELLNSGYTVTSSSGATSGTFSKTGTTVTYYYELDKTKYSTVTVKYQDAETGKSLASDNVYSGLIGSSYSYSPINISGYECDENLTSNASGTFTSSNITVIFKYHETEEETMKIHYYNSSGWPTVAMYVYQGSGDSAKMLSGSWPGTIMTSEGNGWYVGTINTTESAYFIANNNGGGSQDPSGDKPTGYTVQGEVWVKGAKVYKTGKVNVKYVDTDGNVLAKETLTGMADGSNTYSTTSKTFDGYELVSAPTNATGLFTESPITVTYTYRLTHLDELENTSSISSTDIDSGDTITVIGSASGGTSPYTYAVYYKLTSASSYTTAQSFSSNSSVSFSLEAGTYEVLSKVKDSAGTTKSKTFTVNVTGYVTELTNNSTISSESAALGSSITVNCAASGGTLPYTYAVYYKLSSDSSYTTLQNFSTTKTVSFTPSAAGTYNVVTKVKDSTDTVARTSFNVTITGGLTNNTTLSATSVALGSSVTIKCAASGGTSPYTYAVYYKLSSDSSYTTLQNFSTTRTVTFTPSSAGTYNVVTKVKDSTGAVARTSFDVTVTGGLTNKTTLSSTSVALGSTITIKWAASGGTSPYTYAVYYKLSSESSYTTLQYFSTTRTVSFTPTSSGTYSIVTKVKDSTGAVARTAFDVTVKKSLTNKTTLSSTTAALGSTITIKCAASGGISPYTYSIYYKLSSESSYTTLQYQSTTRTVYFTPTKAGAYSVVTKAIDSTGTVAKTSFDVTITKALTNKTTLSSTSVAPGSTITINCAASGGTSPYTYAVYYKLSSDSSYTTLQYFTTTRTVYFTPTTSGTYSVVTKVKDSTGTVARTEFDVTVSNKLTNTTKLSATSITLGKSITVKCAASGGTAPYTYAVYYKKNVATSYTTAQNYSTNTTVTIKPGSATDYTVVVKAKDSTGTVAKKTFSVSVS